MIVTRLRLRNWRNFREADMELRERTYVLGPNASGKSNLLDVFRFLRDVCKPEGGGLQKAVSLRGGMSKLRCLHARRPNDVRIEVELSESSASEAPTWTYSLAFQPEGKGKQRLLVTEEIVKKNGVGILSRPDPSDQVDEVRLTQTHLEQIQANAGFRDVADFFSSVNYLHLVPQLLKYADEIGGRRIEGDPFGQGFLERLARTQEKTRTARLKRIQEALVKAVPQFRELKFSRDDVTGSPHLEALYEHHHPNAGWQREDQLSDGTLRLIALLWSLLEGEELLLLEEPELSLNDGIVKQIPVMLDRIQRVAKRRSQIVVSTHSEALLGNPGIDARGVLVLEAAKEGTRVRTITEEERAALESGFSVAEVVLPKTRPSSVAELGRL